MDGQLKVWPNDIIIAAGYKGGIIDKLATKSLACCKCPGWITTAIEEARLIQQAAKLIGNRRRLRRSSAESDRRKYRLST